ncbi:MAG: sialate O-acetylesterase [Limisphaerales bacterium]|jgi:sialate O-acetylesterase
MKTIIAALCCFLPLGSVAEVVLPVLFRDGMVLQREAPIRVFGQATDDSSITVRLNGYEETATTKNGTWAATLPAMSAGGPHVLHISGDGSDLQIRDVMLGEVWLAGGQSNMAMALRGTTGFQQHLPTAENPRLRFLRIPVTEFGAIKGTGIAWQRFDRNSVMNFSAVTYFFAVELQKRLGVTVGVIGSYRGATWNENWMTPESIRNTPDLRHLFDRYDHE